MKKKMLIIFFLFISIQLFAKTEKDQHSFEVNLEKFLRKMGYEVNVTGQGIYQDQKAFYATGGNISLRNSVIDINPVNIQVPFAIKGGCGGIDIHNGAFSFISGEELIKTLKSIGTNAGTYAFMLAVETMSPQIANNLRSLQGWANQINAIGINSCEGGMQLVGSLLPKTEKASEILCNDIGTSEGFLNDYIRARHECGHSQTAEPINSKIQEMHPEQNFQECNIAWKVIQKNPFLKADRNLAELLMTLTGTVIIKKDNKRQNIITKPAKAFDEGFLNILLKGGTTKIYTCDEHEKCLNVLETEEILAFSETFQGKVKNIIEQIQDHIIKDIELNMEQQQFLESTDLPVLRLLAANLAYHHGKKSADIYQWIDLVSMDLLLKHIRDLLDAAQQSAGTLKPVLLDTSLLDNYIETLENIDMKLRYLEEKTNNRRERELQTLQKLDWLEEKIRSNW